MNYCPDSYTSLYTQLEQRGKKRWAQQLRQALPEHFTAARHGDIVRWQKALAALPDLDPSTVELIDAVRIETANELDAECRAELIKQLKTFHPWRKGPFSLFGLDIDTEWRSDWKWERLLPHIQSLQGRKVLDVGCGNGYHGWRMRGAGADFVLGIDPVMIFVMQHLVMQRYLNDPGHHVVPLRMEDIPADLNFFDSVFSMGVLYHRRSPLDHLLELRRAMRPGGQLILETLIVEGGEGTVFTPEVRYAKMPNVWFLPSIDTLSLWLRRCGFVEIECVDINRTSTGEQRATEWMIEESLADFLDPDDQLKTIEGHPAPLRAILTATRP